MKNKKRIILLICILIIFAIVFIKLTIPSSEETKSVATKTCEKLNENINTNNDTIIFFKPRTMTIEAQETVEELKKNYPNVEVINITEKILKDECIKKTLEDSNAYKDMNKKIDSLIVAYKNGKNIGTIMGLDTYSVVENYLDEIGLIKKKEIKETLNQQDFEEKIKSEKYLLLIVGTEEQRKELTELMQQHFASYKYDVISLKSETGQQIKEYIEQNNEVLNEYPQMFYFENNKLIKYQAAYDEETFVEYKNDLE